MGRKFQIVGGALFIVLATAVFASATTYSTFIVTKTADTNDGVCNFDCSLREAIDAARFNPLPDQNDIFFLIPPNDPNCSRILQACVIVLNSELVVNAIGPVVITGTGAQHLIIDGGSGTDRVFRSSSEFILKDLTVQHGHGLGSSSVVNGKGTAIYHSGLTTGGSLTLKRVVVQNSTTTFFSGNGDGAVYITGGGANKIEDSTISANISSGNCGGLDQTGGTLTITNVTISGNRADGGQGGGVCVGNVSTMTLHQVTISNNFAFNGGGGIFLAGGSLDMGSTIVAGNVGGSTPDFRVFSGSLTTGSGNVIGNNADVTGIFPFPGSVLTDQAGNSATPLSAHLAALGNYGGTTPTQALYSVSPASHGGIIFTQTDQRGALRGFVGTTGDSGAFQLNAVQFVGWSFPQPILNQPYTQTITQDNGSATDCVSAGSLPPGVTGIAVCPTGLTEDEETPLDKSISADRLDFASDKILSPASAITLSGTATISGTFPFSIRTTSGTDIVTTNYQIVVSPPTVAVGGRVATGSGNGISNVIVTLSDPSGATRTTVTNSFGNFRFQGVQAGQGYLVAARSKKYQFSEPSQAVYVGGEVTDLAFIP